MAGVDLCCKCGLRPRRAENDSYCTRCRNEYVRLWKAKKRYGVSLVGYEPVGEKCKPEPREKILGTPRWWGKKSETDK